MTNLILKESSARVSKRTKLVQGRLNAEWPLILEACTSRIASVLMETRCRSTVRLGLAIIWTVDVISMTEVCLGLKRRVLFSSGYVFWLRLWNFGVISQAPLGCHHLRKA